MKHLQGRRNNDTAQLRLANEKAKHLLSLQVRTYNGVRATVNLSALADLYEAVYPLVDASKDAPKPIRDVVRARKGQRDGS